MKHKWESLKIDNDYSNYQCKRCGRIVVVAPEDDDDWHKQLDDCPKSLIPKSTITVRPLSKTPAEEAERLYPHGFESKIAFVNGAKWQRRQYAEQRNELERLKAIRDIRKEILEMEKKK